VIGIRRAGQPPCRAHSSQMLRGWQLRLFDILPTTAYAGNSLALACWASALVADIALAPSGAHR